MSSILVGATRPVRFLEKRQSEMVVFFRYKIPPLHKAKLMDNTEQFCKIVRERSKEHQRAIFVLSGNGLQGQVMSILRQELDSMVRVIFLLSQDMDEREHLINLMLSGQKWKLTSNANVTDRQMVDLADKLNGWTKSVYKFGCAFIHLSSFHSYTTNDPFKDISIDEINSVKSHLNNYHGFPMASDLTMQTISMYLPMVFDKISSNLECYVQYLEGRNTTVISNL